MGVEDFEVDSLIDKADLLNGVDYWISHFTKQSDFLLNIYYVRIGIPRNSTMQMMGAGIATNILIDGERYRIEGGVEKCTLTKSWRNEQGESKEGDPIDIRNKTTIKTDENGSHGDITIIKTKTPYGFVDDLKSLKNFLESQPFNNVRKLLS